MSVLDAHIASVQDHHPSGPRTNRHEGGPVGASSPVLVGTPGVGCPLNLVDLGQQRPGQSHFPRYRFRFPTLLSPQQVLKTPWLR